MQDRYVETPLEPSPPPGQPSPGNEQQEVEPLPEVPSPVTVPKPTHSPGLSLSKDAIDKRLRRVFTPRADGTYQVSDEFVKQYMAKGASREALLVMFEKCDYEPDWCLGVFSFSKVNHVLLKRFSNRQFWKKSSNSFFALYLISPPGEVQDQVPENNWANRWDGAWYRFFFHDGRRYEECKLSTATCLERKYVESGGRDMYSPKSLTLKMEAGKDWFPPIFCP